MYGTRRQFLKKCDVLKKIYKKNTIIHITFFFLNILYFSKISILYIINLNINQ